jgi:prepilin-type N-terminal cleavage/methylation domain-containing protein
MDATRSGRAQRRRILGSRAGVTLVELMVVVTIIAVIAAIAITLYQDVQKKARLASDQGTIGSIRSAISIYYGGNSGTFPGSQAGVLLLLQAPDWQCPGNSAWSYDSASGLAALAVNDTSGC